MAMNMSYCRFENTKLALVECFDAMEEADWDLEAMMDNASSPQEAKAMAHLILRCRGIAEMFEDDDILAIMEKWRAK